MASNRATERVFYVPPNGTPPFEFEMSSTLKAFMPPDQYWKKVPEDYEIGKIVRQDGVETGRLRSVRDKWVPDEERNKRLAEGTELPPENFLDLTRAELVFLNQGRFALQVQHLKRESDIKKSQRDTFDQMQADHKKKMADLRKQLDEAERRMAAVVAKAQAEVEEAANAKKPKAQVYKPGA